MRYRDECPTRSQARQYGEEDAQREGYRHLMEPEPFDCDSANRVYRDAFTDEIGRMERREEERQREEQEERDHWRREQQAEEERQAEEDYFAAMEAQRWAEQEQES